MTLLEVASISKMSLMEVDYDDFCNFVYMREELTEVVAVLSQTLKSFECSSEVQSIVSRLTKQAPVVGADPVCVVCQQKFIHCGHLCANCSVKLEQKPCVMCYKWHYRSRRLEEKNAAEPLSPELLKLVEALETDDG